MGGRIYYNCYVGAHDESAKDAPAYWIRRPQAEGPQFSFVLTRCRLHLQEPPFILTGSTDSGHNRRTLDREMLRTIDPDGDGQATILLWPDFLYTQFEALLPDALARLAFRDYITRLARSKPPLQTLENLRQQVPERWPHRPEPRRRLGIVGFERGETFPLYAVLCETVDGGYLIETFELHLDCLQDTLARLQAAGRTVRVLSCSAEVADFAAVDIQDVRG